MLLGCDVAHSLPSSAKVKNGRSHISIHPICLHDVDRVSFTLHYLPQDCEHSCKCIMISFFWLQRYYMSARSSSPVYGVAFDPCQLFAVLDQSLHVLDFSVFKDTPGIRNPHYNVGWMPWWCWVLPGHFHGCYFFVLSLSPGAMWCVHTACRMYLGWSWGRVQSCFVLVLTHLWELYW